VLQVPLIASETEPESVQLGGSGTPESPGDSVEVRRWFRQTCVQRNRAGGTSSGIAVAIGSVRPVYQMER
jgi:hypothetical protein